MMMTLRVCVPHSYTEYVYTFPPPNYYAGRTFIIIWRPKLDSAQLLELGYHQAEMQ